MTLSRRRPFRTFIGLLLIVIFAGGAFALWVRKTVTTPVEHQSADRIVTIDPGAGPQAIIARLAEAGVVPIH
jgi:cell division protein YceG involved in septum cleavage